MSSIGRQTFTDPIAHSLFRPAQLTTREARASWEAPTLDFLQMVTRDRLVSLHTVPIGIIRSFSFGRHEASLRFAPMGHRSELVKNSILCFSRKRLGKCSSKPGPAFRQLSRTPRVAG